MIQVWGNTPGTQMAGVRGRLTVTDPFSRFLVMHRSYWGTYCAPAADMALDLQSQTRQTQSLPLRASGLALGPMRAW